MTNAETNTERHTMSKRNQDFDPVLPFTCLLYG